MEYQDLCLRPSENEHAITCIDGVKLFFEECFSICTIYGAYMNKIRIGTQGTLTCTCTHVDLYTVCMSGNE